MSSSPIGFAILGAGIFAKEAHLPALGALGPEVVLKAVYSRSKKSASSLAELAKEKLSPSENVSVYSDDGSQEGGLESLLSRTDIQAVVVVLPINQQPDVILQALAAGKNVISEKPIAKDVKTGIALIEKWEKDFKPKGLIWRVAEQFEVEPAYIEAERKIKAGAIGEVRSFSYSVLNSTDQSSPWYNTAWRTVPEYQGGFVLDGGVHNAAALRRILPFSLETATLSGVASLSREYLAPHDTVQAVIQAGPESTKNPHPPHGILELSWSAPAGLKRNVLTIIGTEGYMTLTNASKPPDDKDARLAKAAVFGGKGPNGEQVVTYVHITTYRGDGGNQVEDTEIISSGVVAEIEGFVNAVNGQDDGNGNPRGALQDVAVIQACLQSEGRPIDLKKLISTGEI